MESFKFLQMSRLVPVSLFMIFAISIFYNCGVSRKKVVEEKSDFQGSPLAAYGELVFKRESCGNCHTFDVEQQNSRIISLDGIGGKYSNSWLYYYLFEPQSLNPESKKKPYRELYVRPLDKEMKSALNEGDTWDDLLREAEILEEVFLKEGTAVEKTEILALIAYLQQIPAGKKKLELDSLALKEQLDEQKTWDNLSWDVPNIITETAGNGANKGEGVKLFKAGCVVCHGMKGEGGIGPNLTDDYWLHGSQPSEIAKTIINGVPEKGMISWKSQMKPAEVGALIAYIISIKGSNPENAKAPQGKKE